MNGATLKTVREALGLSVKWLADVSQVEDRSVRYWEAGRMPVPADVAAQIEQLEMLAALMVEQAVAAVRAQVAEHGPLTGPVLLVRYVEAEDLAKYQPDLKGLPPTYHAAALARIRWALEPEGIAVEMRALNASAYEAWRRSTRQPDSPALRSQFVGIE